MRRDTWVDYDIVDVFTDRPFSGNQLAVVHGADRLTDAQCLAIAREFGYSETTFPAAVEPDAGPDPRDGPPIAEQYAVRIFTPAHEIPFAGHPTLGTAWVLRARSLLSTERVVQVCGAGRIEVRLGEAREAREDLVELSATPRELVGPLDAEATGRLARAVGLEEDDVAGEAWVAGCGLSFLHLPVSREALARARPPVGPVEVGPAPVRDAFGDVNVFAVSGSSPQLRVHSRVFVPGAGVPEDPATGSAAAGLGMVLVVSGLLPDGGRYEITQGVEMGRPSALSGRVEAADGRPTLCHVAGLVQAVATGSMRVPDPEDPGSSKT